MSDAYIGVPYINEVSPRFPKEDFVASDFGNITVGSTTHTLYTRTQVLNQEF